MEKPSKMFLQIMSDLFPQPKNICKICSKSITTKDEISKEGYHPKCLSDVMYEALGDPQDYLTDPNDEYHGCNDDIYYPPEDKDFIFLKDPLILKDLEEELLLCGNTDRADELRFYWDKGITIEQVEKEIALEAMEDHSEYQAFCQHYDKELASSQITIEVHPQVFNQ